MSLDYDELCEGGIDPRKLDAMTAEDALPSVFDIEDVLVYLRDVESRVDFLKELKRQRTHKIDESINKYEGQVDKFKTIILNTMRTHEPAKKTIPFPGVGKVGRRKSPAKWVIEDEQKFIEWLSEEDKKSAVKIKESVIKKEADKVLERAKAASKPMPESVQYLEGGESLSVSFEEQIVTEKSAPKSVEVEDCHVSQSEKDSSLLL